MADARALRKEAAVALGVLSGAMVAVQARINGTLATRVGDAVTAACVSFGTGLLVIAALVASREATRHGVRALLAALRTGRLRWWQAVGGAGGAGFVIVQASVVPVVGVALYSVSVVAGQTSSGLAVDRVGLGPAGRAPVTGPRVAAAALTVVAVLVSVSGRLGNASHLVALAAAVAAGAVVAAQQAVNGHVSRASGQPQVAGLLNFLTGGVVLALVLLVRALLGAGPEHGLPHEWWLYVGGTLGLVSIVAAAAVVRVLGVLTLGLCSVLGQLGGSLVVDAVAPVHGQGVTWRGVLGAALTGVAVLVAQRRRGRAA
ncbi:transporter family-2 protein [Motilibacter peucedani]|uniref:Transporter family-2 protein n=1 Tax=Motilibacter peucedani TaxID=598650 RepID=A0A420XLD0_9ACTN|nr:DMT family transporter [Motilibacter peucedani]RKS69353.1 transporter family-2 protein [Motilibacter peucedani]